MQGIGSCEDEIDRGKVFKLGSRTGVTSGKISEVRFDVKMPEDEYLPEASPSQEFVLFSRLNLNMPSGMPGDSGGFVFSDRRKFMGLTFAECKIAMYTRNTMVFVTDAGAILKDMNDRCTDFRFELV